MALKRIKCVRDDVVYRAMLAILVGECESPRDMRFFELSHQAIEPGGQLGRNTDHPPSVCHHAPLSMSTRSAFSLSR
jgi:hypothetical protein